MSCLTYYYKTIIQTYQKRNNGIHFAPFESIKN